MKDYAISNRTAKDRKEEREKIEESISFLVQLAFKMAPEFNIISSVVIKMTAE